MPDLAFGGQAETGAVQLSGTANLHRDCDEPARNRAATWSRRQARTLHQGPNVLVIPATGNPAHLEENLDGALRLSDTELTAISASGPARSGTT
jgi:pyridoxine 4-dehydrogenase